MADYTSTNNNIIGSDYISGLVSGFEDYMVIPISSEQTVVLQGKFDKEVSGTEISFEGERWIIDRGSGYNYNYTSTYSPSVNCTVSVPNPYYCRGSLTDMSVLDCRRAEVSGNFATITILWGVLICVVAWDLLRSCLRSRF